MNPWREVLKALQMELDRLSQEVGGRPVLPNGATVRLPRSRFEPYSPLLSSMAAELGQSLHTWANDTGRDWYGSKGPYLVLEIEEIGEPEIVCDFFAELPEE